MLSGELWFRVPEIIEVRLEGQTQEGVYPKDVILAVLGKIKADGAVYKAIDFTGSYVDSLSVAGRMTICNMAVEMGAKTAYMQPNQEVLDYVTQRAVRPFEVQHTDADFVYSESHILDVSQLTPQIAVPNSVDNVFPIEQVERVKVNQCFVGTCTGGRLEDLKAAADIVRGKKIAEGIRFIVIPASNEVMKKAMELGYISDFMDAGATLSTPGCGPCLGAHEGILAKDEVCVAASNRNFPGRMGHRDAKIYLASPAIVAATALSGYLENPKFNEKGL